MSLIDFSFLNLECSNCGKVFGAHRSADDSCPNDDEKISGWYIEGQFFGNRDEESEE